MEINTMAAWEPGNHNSMACGLDGQSKLQQQHDALSSKLEQQVGLIATCFRLKQPQSGFSPTEWLVLSALANTTECGLKLLAQQVSISCSTTTKIVRRLLMMHLVEWKHSDKERRSYALSITAHGIKTYRQTRRDAVRRNAACFGPLTVEQLEQVTSLLDLCMPAGKFSLQTAPSRSSISDNHKTRTEECMW